MGSYVSGLGQPPFDPRMMVSLLLHGIVWIKMPVEVSGMTIVRAAFATKLGYYGFEFRGVVKGGLDRLDRQR